ncbi:hypothetical protein SAMN04488078_103710 [Antarctobacter heliothermus]|uniref:Uncharacterized protein n=1 Tax=Antarctobacter heliothermus TaxID=74033 RepID=A0A239HVF7_9RHOB|nr:hypothetical protein SAMN04488078_103710 [Antarctobacter heliothermus]
MEYSRRPSINNRQSKYPETTCLGLTPKEDHRAAGIYGIPLEKRKKPQANAEFSRKFETAVS